VCCVFCVLRTVYYMKTGVFLVVTPCASCKIFVTMMKEVQVPPKRRFLQEPQGITTQKTPFFIVTAVKTSNLSCVLHVSI
jgi:hypothetical protein